MIVNHRLVTEIWKLPVPATALIGGPVFVQLPKRQVQISFEIEESDASKTISLIFEKVAAYKCTYLVACTSSMFNLAYGKLVRLEATSWLAEITSVVKAIGKDDTVRLKHLMICFDDGPCYEVVCQDYRLAT